MASLYTVNLGYYLSEDEAGKVYEQAAALYHGEFYRPWRP